MGKNRDEYEKLLDQLKSSYTEEDIINVITKIVKKFSTELWREMIFSNPYFKSLFEDVNYFDGFSFFPCFCEDDDFLIRTKLKGYDIKTTEEAITYHFVSKTSRFSDEYKDTTRQNEFNRKFSYFYME